jgi:hypothetical protein
VTACALAEGFTAHPDPERRVRPVTAANYIEGLMALGRAGGVSAASLAAMRIVTDDLRNRAALMEKKKEARLEALMALGGYDHVARCVEREVRLAREAPAHSALAFQALRRAVFCAVVMNKPPRKGDAARWRFGHELSRAPCGAWHARWEQEKTGHETDVALWPEIGALLDLWVLGGRPARQIHLRMAALAGMNWLSLEAAPPRRNLPTEITTATLGVPSHDLRTLAADYLRLHDPARAADVLATHLGHVSTAAGTPYRALCDGDAQAREWQAVRAELAGSGGAARPFARPAGRPGAL